MIDILSSSAEILSESGFMIRRESINGREFLLFEDDIVLGFLFTYVDSHKLIEAWDSDANRAITDHQLGLRRAALKSWNTYVVFLAGGETDNANYINNAPLAAIEEDLAGTRKIARANIADASDLREALLPLLPLQTAPKLGAVDLKVEIRQRATEVPQRAIDAFLSTAEQAVVLQVLEETP